MKTSKIISFTLIVLGIATGVWIERHFWAPLPLEKTEIASEKKPLYWVAPMDPNYRRDQPGKSPMGMDLIPVYEEETSPEHADTIRLSPGIRQTMNIRVDYAQRKALPRDITALGNVSFDAASIVHVHPRVSGWVQQLSVYRNGDAITAGQPLYSLYSPELVNAQEEYVLAIKQGVAALKIAAEQRLRALEVPESLIEQLRNGGDAAIYVTFYAPISGVVHMLNVQNGFYVTPGMTMLSIADNKRLQIDAQLLGTGSHLLRVGDPVTVTPLENSLPKTWRGHIAQIYAEASSLTRQREFRVALNGDTSELFPQQWVKVHIQGPLPQERLMVPSTAVINTGKHARVVVETAPNQFRSVEVTTGEVVGGYTEILGGLEDNSKVVVSGQFLMDSESSTSAEFVRMQDNQEDTPPYQSATVNGDIIEVYADRKVVLIHRDAIPKWGRAAATVEFMIDPSVDIDRFISGQRVRFTFDVRDELVITDVSNVPEEHHHAH